MKGPPGRGRGVVAPAGGGAPGPGGRGATAPASVSGEADPGKEEVAVVVAVNLLISRVILVVSVFCLRKGVPKILAARSADQLI